VTDFAINIIVDPSKSATGNKQVQDHLQKTSEHADSLRESITHAFEFIGIGFGIRELIRLTDEFTTAQNRLRSIIEDERRVTEVSERLGRVADEARVNNDELVGTFVRLSNATKNLGVSQEEVIDFTEVMTKAMVSSGVEGGRAMNILSYGLSQGVIRGRELRVFMMQMPAVAELLAKGLGTTTDQLKALGDEGKISAKAFLDAFKSMRVEVDERFGRVVPSVSSAIVVLKNNFQGLVGSVGGLTSGLIAVINVVSSFTKMLSGGLSKAHEAGKTVIAMTSSLTVAMIALKASNPYIALAAAGGSLLLMINRMNEATRGLTEQSVRLTKFAEIGVQIIRLQKLVDDLEGRKVQTSGTIAMIARYRAEIDALQGKMDSFDKAKINYNATVEETLQNLKDENFLLQLNNRDREIERKLLEEEKKLKKTTGVDMSREDTQRYQTQLLRNRSLREQDEILTRVREPLQRLKIEEDAYNAALRTGKIRTDEMRLAAQQHEDAMRKLQLAIDQADNSISGGFAAGLDEINVKIHDVNGTISQGLVGAFDTAEKSLVSFVRTGKFSIKDFANSMLDEIAKVLVKLLELQIMEAITGTGGGGMLYTAAGGGSATLVTPGARAGGGDVDAGKPCLVGEEGPEIFAPAGSGTIVPADRTASIMGGGGATNVSVPVQVVNVHSDEEVASRINSAPGAKAIINVLIDNKEAVKRLLA